MISIWNFKIDKKNIFWFINLPFIAILFEIFQYFKIIPGTFDIFDICFYFSW